jgi:predicted  nucleic acid-binding Zn-ribbon protein
MKNDMKKSWPVLVFLILMLTLSSLSQAQNGFTQKDRELLIQLNTRINEMEKRFADLREDMNKRFEQVDKRFEQVDKRFAELREDMNNRFGEMMTYIGILAAIFAAITVGTIGFALWDRRTMIRPFESKVVDLDKKITENKDKYENLISALKEYADKNKKFADSIRQFNLF